MKICSRCHQSKPESEFNRNRSKKDGLNRYCRPCNRAYQNLQYANWSGVRRSYKQNRRRSAKLFIFEYLWNHPCVDCGEKDIVVLDFDHRANKADSISNLMHFRYDVDELKAEVAKCDVRCANCHRRRHGKDNSRARYSTMRLEEMNVEGKT